LDEILHYQLGKQHFNDLSEASLTNSIARATSETHVHTHLRLNR